MSLECSYDCDYSVELSQELVTSVGTEFCVECGQLIHVGVEHYVVWEYDYDEDGYEVHKGRHPCCEVCGDLALSFLAMGFCWTYGDLRDDITMMNAAEGRL